MHTQEQTPCQCAELADLRADLEFANARISDYQNTVESLEAANRTKTAHNEELHREIATLRAMLGQSNKAMRVTMVQNLARRTA